jgi:hypothetical protein
MENEVNKLNWEDIMNRFSTYQGRIVDFCKENKIKQNQLYHRRKRLEKEKKQSFHAISVKKDDVINLPAKRDSIIGSNCATAL